MDPGPLRDALTLALGVVTGILSASFGVGGAVLSTPGVRLLGASALVAVGTTLPSILPSAISGTHRYSREQLVDWEVVATTVPFGVAAAVLGSLASHAVPGDGHWLMVLTAGLLFITAWRLRQDPQSVNGNSGDNYEPRRSPLLRAAVGTGAGLLSGLLGVGGGTVLVPGFSQILRMPIKATIATSLACVGILAVPSTITHAFLDDIDWRLALLLAVGVIPGARIGAAAAIAASERRLRVTVASLLALIAVFYAAGEITALVR